MKRQIKASSLSKISYRRAAEKLLALEAMILLGIVVVIAVLWIYLGGNCWFGWFGPGAITVVDRYYRVNSESIRFVDPGEDRHVPRGDISLGVKLSLRQECYCSDIYAEIHSYTASASGKWVESPFGEGKLLPLDEDTTTLEGKWVRPPPDRYRIEVRLKCSSHSDVSISVFDYTTFTL